MNNESCLKQLNLLYTIKYFTHGVPCVGTNPCKRDNAHCNSANQTHFTEKKAMQTPACADIFLLRRGKMTVEQKVLSLLEALEVEHAIAARALV